MLGPEVDNATLFRWMVYLLAQNTDRFNPYMPAGDRRIDVSFSWSEVAIR